MQTMTYLVAVWKTQIYKYIVRTWFTVHNLEFLLIMGNIKRLLISRYRARFIRSMLKFGLSSRIGLKFHSSNVVFD